MKKSFFVLTLLIVICMMTLTACGIGQSLSLIREVQLKELGNAKIGPGIVGEIDGKDYLFLAKSGQGSTTLIETIKPGVLVFDLMNPSNPTQIASLESQDQTMQVQELELAG